MRVFIAIDIDKTTRKALSSLQQQLQQQSDIKKSDARWVNVENIHLTLKFLGEVKDKQITEICAITEKVTKNHKSFELDIKSVGFFGGKSAKVLWVDTGDGQENLLQLQQELERELAIIGWPAETRKFSGHLTLCRIKNANAGCKLAKISENFKDLKAGTISVDSVSVYQSQLMQTGPIYTVIGKYILK